MITIIISGGCIQLVKKITFRKLKTTKHSSSFRWQNIYIHATQQERMKSTRISFCVCLFISTSCVCSDKMMKKLNKSKKQHRQWIQKRFGLNLHAVGVQNCWFTQYHLIDPHAAQFTHNNFNISKEMAVSFLLFLFFLMNMEWNGMEWICIIFYIVICL